MEEIAVLGIMSGTSLDGVDLAYCTFSKKSNSWKYKIEYAETIPYSSEWNKLLREAKTLSSIDLLTLHSKYGKYLGEISKKFIQQQKAEPRLIASHGHTIFHQPDRSFTFQLGHGSAIAAITGVDTVWDFRSGDVQLGGQGAPLVPIGDRYLFSKYDVCLNLGGFGNLSFEEAGKRKAYDTSPVNFVLNQLASEMGQPFDHNGDLGKRGQLIPELLEKLNRLEYYKQDGPKSLGQEWVEKEFTPIVNLFSHQPVSDRLCTIYHHIAQQIGACVSKTNAKSILVTGGGAKNSFLISLLRQQQRGTIVIPDILTIDFKEALIFAFLGVLYTNNIESSLTSVTGASINSIAGVLSKGTRVSQRS